MRSKKLANGAGPYRSSVMMPELAGGVVDVDGGDEGGWEEGLCAQ